MIKLPKVGLNVIVPVRTTKAPKSSIRFALDTYLIYVKSI
jgi:hypothetical protein